MKAPKSLVLGGLDMMLGVSFGFRYKYAWSEILSRQTAKVGVETSRKFLLGAATTPNSLLTARWYSLFFVFVKRRKGEKSGA